MIKIEIKNTKVEQFSGVGKRSGKPFTMNNQMGYVNLPDVNGEILRRSIKITLPDGQQPYPVGVYQLALSSLMVDSFGRLSVGRIVLEPLQVQQAVRAA